MRAWAALGVIGAALAVITPLPARADAITVPPSCPEGSTDAFCHGPATCRPRGCVSASDCNAGEVCASRDLCTEVHTCFGFPTSTMVNDVLGYCDASGACPSGGTCGSFFICTAGPVTVDAGMDAGVVPEHVTACACRAGARGGSALALVSMLALAARMLWRRAR